MGHTSPSSQDPQGSPQGGLYRCVASCPRVVRGRSRRPAGLLPPHGDEQEDLPHRQGHRQQERHHRPRLDREDHHTCGRLPPLRPGARGLHHAQGRRHGAQEEGHHPSQVALPADFPCGSGEDQPQVHRHLVQVRPRPLPNLRGEIQVHGRHQGQGRRRGQAGRQEGEDGRVSAPPASPEEGYFSTSPTFELVHHCGDPEQQNPVPWSRSRTV
mmetsp:Transcript_6991/g.11974  ORF Transcript_6991/g.11974 Transcript_6991/m.11974 type:complete len:213 (-) Transcript_6991:444-1082(-)